jgi:repressor LexA
MGDTLRGKRPGLLQRLADMREERGHNASWEEIVAVANGERPFDNERNGVLTIPLLGSIAAGDAIDSHYLEDWQVPAQMLRGVKNFREVFALRVRGDSMIEAGILPNDIVLLKRQQTADNGDIVAVQIQSENCQDHVATLKRFQRDSRGVRLISENRAYAPRILQEKDQFWIAGKLIGVMRNYA